MGQIVETRVYVQPSYKRSINIKVLSYCSKVRKLVQTMDGCFAMNLIFLKTLCFCSRM